MQPSTQSVTADALDDAPTAYTPEESEAADHYIHPVARTWFAHVPFLAYIPLFNKVASAFGPQFALAVGLCYTLSKGAASNIINVSRQPMFVVRYGIDVARYQRLASMYSMGWSLKPFMAVITDTIAFMGYTKRWYLCLSALLGTVFALAYALLPAKPSSANTAAAFVFLTCFCKANIDILTQGHFSRAMRSNPVAGPSVVSWVWAMTFIGTVISACMMGPLSDAGKTWIGVLVSAVLQFCTFFFFVFNLYGEKKNRTERRKDALMEYQALQALRQEEAAKGVEGVVAEPAHGAAQELREDDDDEALYEGVPRDELEAEGFKETDIPTCLCGAFEFNVDVAKRNWRMVVYSIVMTGGIIALACVTVLGTRWQLLYACIAIAVAFVVGAFLSLPLVIAKAAVFLYLNSVLYLQIPGALSNYYVASPQCVPDGPHFSYTFYQTVGALITNFGGVLGSFLFTSFFYKHRYVTVFIVTTLLQIAGSIFDLIIVKRWNIYIGIPDHAMYILGDAIVYEVCFVFSIMPAQILMSRLCPRGTESMAFAIFAGFSSAGNSMSLAIGSLLMESFWPVTTKIPCDFSNVPYLIITGHFCTPLLIVPLAFLLLPRARICDSIDSHGRVIDQDKGTAAPRGGSRSNEYDDLAAQHPSEGQPSGAPRDATEPDGAVDKAGTYAAPRGQRETTEVFETSDMEK